jgi:hypothetical protein
VHVPLSPRTLCAPSAGVGSDAWAGSVHPRPRRAGATPRPTSLAGGPHEQAASPRRAGCASSALGREGRCRPRPRADFGTVTRELKKSFSIFHSV